MFDYDMGGDRKECQFNYEQILRKFDWSGALQGSSIGWEAKKQEIFVSNSSSDGSGAKVKDRLSPMLKN